MSKFANYEDGKLSINTYRFVGAVATDIKDVCDSWKSQTAETLTADIDDGKDIEKIESLIAIQEETIF